MMKFLSVIAFCLCAIAVNGCLNEDPQLSEDSIVNAVQCGSRVCTGKTFCCNASCGVCAPIGGGCTQQECRADDDNPVTDGEAQVSTPEPADTNVIIDPGPIGPRQCGSVTCTGNTHCCNASCGTCVGPGQECTQQVCEPRD